MVAGEHVGRAEIVTTLRPLLFYTGLIAILSACLGQIAHFAVRRFPLRVLDGTLKALEERNWQLDGALKNVPIGISMYDSEGRLVVCNDRYREIFQFAPEIPLVGLTVAELSHVLVTSGVDVADFGKILQDSRASRFEAGAVRAHNVVNGRTIASTTQWASGGRIINVHQDVTLLEELHAVLAKQHDDLAAKNSQLGIALANMEQGLSMFDAEHRLIVANKRYAQIYDFRPDLLQPGTHIMEFLKFRIERGDVSRESAEAYLAKRLADVERGLSSISIDDLRDGRRVSVRYNPLPQGGWVSTHEDVTEATEREAKIVYMAQHDALTGLCNRYTLADRLKDEFSRCDRGHRFALLAVDLDHFKPVNDRHGHAVGDTLLREVGAGRVSTSVGISCVAVSG